MRSGKNDMKKFLLGTVGLVALGMAAPAVAADLPARAYTKAPAPVVAAIYDWSGFYIGANGGYGTNRSRIDAFGLFTGQIGYTWNNVLWYAKGGAAVTSDKYTGLTTATGVAFDSANETRWGAVVGTGLEFGFTPNWSAAFEYDHIFNGDRNVALTSVTTGALSRTDRIQQDVDLFTVRVNYRWGGPVIAKY